VSSSLAAVSEPALLVSEPLVSEPLVEPAPGAFPGSSALTSFEAALEVIRTAIAGGGWVLCLGHIQPDGDALGSALALAYAIKKAGGRAVVSFDPGPLPFGLPPSLHFLPGEELLADPEQLPSGLAGPSAVITFDTGSVERLGSLAPFARAEPGDPPVLVIDHHARGTEFGTVRLVDGSVAATAEMVAALVDALGVPFNSEIASCLYTGLASDTGSFRYTATSPASHRLAARLLESGARHDTISTLLWDTRPTGYLTALTAALARLQHEDNLIWTYIDAADMTAAGASAEDAEGVVDVIRVAREYEVAVVLKADVKADLAGEPDTWKASVRSRGGVDVGAACTALGGGGHRLAAGFSAVGEPAAIIARLRAVLAAAG
jgi:bifunctional oligoribonuclease and PAP phosphatase NrnA